MKSLYINAASGISGDMMVAALLDLGANEEKLKQVLATLSDQRFQIHISWVQKAALDACDFAVVLPKDNHDHDMTYLFPHRHEEKTCCGHHHAHHHEHHHHGHHHGHHCHCQHEQHHGHDHHHHHHEHHEHRNLSDVLKIIFETKATPKAKELAQKIFTILAEAEAKAHNKSIQEVHFHEVGALDSIIDILSVAVLVDDLGIDDVIVSPLSEGYGQIRCQHGLLPIPVPAVAHIASRYQLILKSCPIEAELVTPTGAAIVAALKTQETLPNQYRILKTGLGAGKRAYAIPSLLRLMIIESVENQKTDTIIKLESNIDDTTPEVLGYVLEKLIQEGALDVSYSPLFMKKNRPAYEINVICTEDKREKLERIIFKETTTIGIRYQKMERSILKREIHSIETPLGPVDVKVCSLPSFENEGKIEKYYPEYESVKAIALKHQRSFQEVYQMALKASQNHV